MFIPDPDFFHPGSLIPSPTTTKRGEKQLVVVIFWCHKLHKIEDYQIILTATE
jgi:hypothetical protein